MYFLFHTFSIVITADKTMHSIFVNYCKSFIIQFLFWTRGSFTQFDFRMNAKNVPVSLLNIACQFVLWI